MFAEGSGLCSLCAQKKSMSSELMVIPSSPLANRNSWFLLPYLLTRPLQLPPHDFPKLNQKEMGLLNHMVVLVLMFGETSIFFSPLLQHHFAFPPTVHEGSNFSASSPIAVFHFFSNSHLIVMCVR